MSEVKTEVCFFKDDLGKNLYKKKTYYIMEVEQEVLAKDKDEADNLFLEGGGIDYDEIKHQSLKLIKELRHLTLMLVIPRVMIHNTLVK